MRFGIDFGTTRIVIAAVDRGNYPIASFECPDGASREWMPPLLALRGAERLYGWKAWAALGEPGVVAVRSLKRVLADAGPSTLLRCGDQTLPISLILSEMTGALHESLARHSSIILRPGERMEVMLGVPANANSNQRFLTAEAFRAADFDVLGLLNEPSAASIEFAHRLGHIESASRELILVYDLGGGTFDVSLVERDGLDHSVLASEGIPTLGGDDFDDILAGLALETAGLARERLALSAAEEFLLLEECRDKKESLHPNTRRLVLDLETVREGWGQVAISVADFYARAHPLVEETLGATEDLLSRAPEGAPISLYVTGGASDLPLVGRLLRERFGRKVKRSAYTRAATAIGLAIQSDAASGYRLRERFTRHFGVWREGEGGRAIIFDPLFERGQLLPGPGEPRLVRSRRYSPAHNVGHFRYMECSRRDDAGAPVGDLTVWDEIRFAFDPALKELEDLTAVAVARNPETSRHVIEERYEADASGTVSVEIENLTAGYKRTYRLGRWSSSEQPAAPAKAPRPRRRPGT
jgi:molecular chaperone DnaK (HSP70)